MADPWSDSSWLVIARIVPAHSRRRSQRSLTCPLWQLAMHQYDEGAGRRRAERERGKAEEHEWNRDIQKVGNKRENN